MILIVAFLIVSGFSAVNTLPRAEDPAITNRNASISTIFPGASAKRVESLITEVIENRLRQLNEIILINSTSRQGVSVISIELNEEIVDTDQFGQKLETNCQK